MIAIPKNMQLPLGIVAAVVVLGIIAKKQVAGAVDAIATVNEGTPFQGTGIVGTLGNVTNQASGGLFARFGSFIARTLDPNENKSIDELTGG